MREVMERGHGGSIMDHFQDLEYPRIERSKRHRLPDIVAIAVCALICGADSWVHVEPFGKSKEEWFRTFLYLPHGNTPTTLSATCSPVWTRTASRIRAGYAKITGPGTWQR